jgi:hypothetical protein
LAKVSGTPFSARSMAGARTFWRGIDPKRSSAVSQPPRLPGVAHDFGPPASSSSVHRAGSAPSGAGPMKSSTCRSRVRAREISISPMPAAPDMNGSTTFRVEPTATAASTALPPSSSTRMPDIDASGCADATAPRVPMIVGR